MTTPQVPTALALARRFVGEVRERPGGAHHPFIQWAHSLCRLGDDVADEVPWCASFVTAVAWLLELPRSHSAAARSWLTVGDEVPLSMAVAGFDIVVLKRGASPTAGHVGFYVGAQNGSVLLLGGNQGNAVTIAAFPRSDVLGVRRLA